MSSSLLLQQCPACLVCLTWIVFVMGGRWPYSCCFVGCCPQDLFNIAPSETLKDTDSADVLMCLTNLAPAKSLLHSLVEQQEEEFKGSIYKL